MTGDYVSFGPNGVRVDLDRYFRTPEGRAALAKSKGPVPKFEDDPLPRIASALERIAKALESGGRAA